MSICSGTKLLFTDSLRQRKSQYPKQHSRTKTLTPAATPRPLVAALQINVSHTAEVENQGGYAKYSRRARGCHTYRCRSLFICVETGQLGGRLPSFQFIQDTAPDSQWSHFHSCGCLRAWLGLRTAPRTLAFRYHIKRPKGGAIGGRFNARLTHL